jgi:cytochrome oxidase assembly protein ShyY1
MFRSGARAFARRLSTSASEAAPISGILLFGGLTAATGFLGVWQIQRFFWKSELISDRAGALSAPVVDMSAGARPTAARAYARASVQNATPEISRAAVIEPRVAPPDLPQSLVARQVANSGRCLVVPLRRSDGTRILALIGWVPADASTRDALAAFSARAAAAVAFSGVVRESEDPGVWRADHGHPSGAGAVAATTAAAAAAAAAPAAAPAADDDTAAPAFTFIDIARIAAACGLDAGRGDVCDALIELVEPPPRADARGAPWPVTRGYAAFAEASTPPSTHAIYAGTWLTLAAYGAAATLRRARGGRGRGGERRLVR